jgi:hypothetical protein
LPSNDKGYTYRYEYTDGLEGFLKYAVEMGSGAVIYIPRLVQAFKR